MDTEPDPLVAGPHIPDQVIAAAKSVADLLAYLAAVTRYLAAVPTGPDLGAVLSHLTDVGPRLSQVLQQLDDSATRIADDPTLYHDQGGDARRTAHRVAMHCQQAASVALVLGRGIDEAHQHAARLGHRPASGTGEINP